MGKHLLIIAVVTRITAIRKKNNSNNWNPSIPGQDCASIGFDKPPKKIALTLEPWRYLAGSGGLSK